MEMHQLDLQRKALFELDVFKEKGQCGCSIENPLKKDHH